MANQEGAASSLMRPKSDACVLCRCTYILSAVNGCRGRFREKEWLASGSVLFAERRGPDGVQATCVDAELSDQPGHGRFDGENCNCGSVDVRDEPWDMHVPKTTQVCEGTEARHAR